MTLPLRPRFWSLIDERGPDDCWPWLGTIDRIGYAHYGESKRLGTNLVHRLLWINAYGEPPKGWEVDHLCRNRSCANLAHFEAVTKQVNIDRRHHRHTEVCPQGHPRIDLYINPNTGSHNCRRCVAEATKAWLDRDGNRERQNRMRAERRAAGR